MSMVIPQDLPQDVMEWDEHHVRDLLRANHVSEGAIQILIQGEVTGCSLLVLTKDELLDDLKLKGGPALSIASIIEELTKVKGLDRESRKRSPPSSFAIPAAKRPRDVQDSYVEELNTTIPGPSSAAYHVKFRDLNRRGRFLNLRPPEARGRPISLFHPVFNDFLRNLQDESQIIPAKCYHQVLEFTQTAGQIYNVASERQAAMEPHFRDLMNGLAVFGYITDNGANLDAISLAGPIDAAAIIWVFKNEMGSGSVDASIQAAVCYAKFWAQEKVKYLRLRTCCPSILIAVVGPYMCILGAVFLERVVVEPLTDFIFCADRPSDQGIRIGVLARLFNALTKAHQQLSSYYKAMAQVPGPTDTSISLQPFLNQFMQDAKIVKFTYREALYDTKLLWRAKMEGGDQVVVKFTKRYHPEAHRLLQDAHLAPRLYYASAIDDGPRPWWMVVMEYIAQPLKPHNLSPMQAKAVYQSVNKAVGQLHEHNLVFGDLRLPNILVQATSKGALRTSLVDFDWCGEDGVTRYPHDLNPEITWPDGAGPNGLITKAHDISNLQALHTVLGLGHYSE